MVGDALVGGALVGDALVGDAFVGGAKVGSALVGGALVGGVGVYAAGHPDEYAVGVSVGALVENLPSAHVVQEQPRHQRCS